VACGYFSKAEFCSFLVARLEAPYKILLKFVTFLRQSQSAPKLESQRSPFHPKPTPGAGINRQILSTIVMPPYEPTSRPPTIS
jgi:hypothetical protein